MDANSIGLALFAIGLLGAVTWMLARLIGALRIGAAIIAVAVAGWLTGSAQTGYRIALAGLALIAVVGTLRRRKA